MSAWNYLLMAFAAAVLALFGFRLVRSVRLFLRFRGNRLVTCPETKKPAAVAVAAHQAAARAMLGDRYVRLRECSRWPERQDCGQDCLSEVESAPEACLVWNIVAGWYHGQSCAVCGKPFDELHHLDHPPGLLSPDRTTVRWDDVPIEKLPEVFATHWPVCWNCHMTHRFRLEHPDLIIDRPWRRDAGGGYTCDVQEEHRVLHT